MARVREGRAVGLFCAMRPVCFSSEAAPLNHSCGIRTHQHDGPAETHDNHDEKDLRKEDISDPHDEHDAPPQQWRGAVACVC